MRLSLGVSPSPSPFNINLIFFCLVAKRFVLSIIAGKYLLFYSNQEYYVFMDSTNNKAGGKGGPPAAYQRNLETSIDKHFYDKVGNSVGNRKLVNSFIIPIRTGQAWEVRKGQVCRITTPNGPQVGDLNIWNLQNPRERFWASRTRQLQRSHVSIYDQLWSVLPFLRPMVTITGDSLADYGIDEDGGRVHDLLGTRCDPYVNKMLTGQDFDFSCHSNLVRAIIPHKLTEFDVHDVVNVFQCTGLNSEGKYFMKTCPAKKGDFFEFFAEMDVLCALSACPSGDQSVPLWGKETTDKILEGICRPLGVEVYELDPTLLKQRNLLQEPPSYRNCHGLAFPKWAK